MLHQLFSSALGIFLALFPMTNPLGAIPIFYSLAASQSPSTRGRQARQVALNIVVVLIIFFLAGRLILDFFGISLGVLQMAGGLLVAHTAWQMMTNHAPDVIPETQETALGKDISLIPMAIPIVSGPGAIGMAIARSAQNSDWSDYLGNLLGIGILGAALYLCLALGEPLVKVIGKSSFKAFNQVLGFFILAVAIQLTFDGTLTLLNESLSEISSAIG